MASMNALPDEILSNIFHLLPTNSFLPTAHVSKRFHSVWVNRVSRLCHSSREKPLFTTNPLQLGNLFQSHWNALVPSRLNTCLLEYYISCGWNSPVMMQRVLREAAARGDVKGMMNLVGRNLCNKSDTDICTVTGAAGHLQALRWLREEKQWPWDPTEVMREASENLHVAIMTYVEQNSAGYEIQTPSYGDGLPW